VPALAVAIAAPLTAAAAEALKVPFEYHKLDNGLKVVRWAERASLIYLNI
jgi:hypothetical protein